MRSSDWSSDVCSSDLSPEAGVRINTIRVCSYVEQPKVQFAKLKLNGKSRPAPEPLGRRECHFVGIDKAVDTPIYGEDAQVEGTRIEGPRSEEHTSELQSLMRNS